MGNSQSSRERHDDHSVDGGQLVPFGLYSSQDYAVQAVAQLIVDRKLAPFYRPLEDYDESWDEERVLAARKQFPAPQSVPDDHSETSQVLPPAPVLSRFKSKSSEKDKPAPVSDAQQRANEVGIYRGAVECPICLLYYPANINTSRCCDQAICTECFVQIKRADPTPNHLVSEPAACPYCVRDNFGVVYTPPPWRAGIGADSSHRPDFTSKASNSSSTSTGSKRKSISHMSPDVVLVDHIHPDWEQKLAQVQAAVARRANRRIIMRQVGDRLIPVGVTSGRVQLIPGNHGAAVLGDGNGALLVPDAPSLVVGDEGGRRGGRNRGPRNQDLSQLLGGMALGGQDLEELMLMEAMRLSLIEHEEHQRREREAAARAAAQSGQASTSASAPATASPISQAATSSPTRSGHTGGLLSTTAVQNLTSSALGRAALSGALAIGLPPPAPAGPASSYPPSAVQGGSLVPVPSPTTTSASPPPQIPTPSATIDAEVQARLPPPLEPERDAPPAR